MFCTDLFWSKLSLQQWIYYIIFLSREYLDHPAVSTVDGKSYFPIDNSQKWFPTLSLIFGNVMDFARMVAKFGEIFMKFLLSVSCEVWRIFPQTFWLKLCSFSLTPVLFFPWAQWDTFLFLDATSSPTLEGLAAGESMWWREQKNKNPFLDQNDKKWFQCRHDRDHMNISAR